MKWVGAGKIMKYYLSEPKTFPYYFKYESQN